MKWWTLHGGEFEREVTAETTHLICSIEEFKRRGPQGELLWICVLGFGRAWVMLLCMLIMAHYLSFMDR